MATGTEPQTRERALSHQEYLDTLRRPTVAEWRRISDVQKRQEIEIDAKYHTSQAREAATTIQKAYRGHRARRELQGLTLDPSSRWVELIRELRFREATAPHRGSTSPRMSNEQRQRASSDMAKRNWQRIGHIAEHAGGAEVRSPGREPEDYLSAHSRSNSDEQPPKAAQSMLMDSRYFLEMVDHKHRYGSNLQVYHEEWLRTGAQQNFFYWLDHGEGRHLDLPGCSRAKLDKESIRYLSRDERTAYLVNIDDQGRLRWHKNGELITTSAEEYKDSLQGVVPKDATDAPAFTDEDIARQRSDDRQAFANLLRARSPDPSSSSSDSSSTDSSLRPTSSNELTVPTKRGTKPKAKLIVSPATILNKLLRASIKPGTWIYVCDTVGRLYVGIKASGAFQHASFLAGARISSAGSIGIQDGRLAYLAPLSGHYRPTTLSFRRFIESLREQGVDLSAVRVSKTYEILQGLEVYGGVKKEVKSVLKGEGGSRHWRKRVSRKDRSKSPEPEGKFHVAADEDSLTATNMVESGWQREHRKGIHKLMHDLRISRRTG